MARVINVKTKRRLMNPCAIVKKPLDCGAKSKKENKEEMMKTLMSAKEDLSSKVKEAINRPHLDHSHHLIVEFFLSYLWPTFVFGLAHFSSRVCSW